MYVLCLCVHEKMRDSGLLASIPLYSLSFIPLFGARSQVELTLGCVLSAPCGGDGVSLCHVRPLSMVLQAETHRDRERDRGRAGGGPLGRVSEECFPLEGSCGRPLLVLSTFEKEGKRKRSMQKYYTEIYFIFLNNHLSV